MARPLPGHVRRRPHAVFPIWSGDADRGDAAVAASGLRGAAVGGTRPRAAGPGGGRRTVRRVATQRAWRRLRLRRTRAPCGHRAGVGVFRSPPRPPSERRNAPQAGPGGRLRQRAGCSRCTGGVGLSSQSSTRSRTAMPAGTSLQSPPTWRGEPRCGPRCIGGSLRLHAPDRYGGIDVDGPGALIAGDGYSGTQP